MTLTLLHPGKRSMNGTSLVEFKSGRCFLGALPAACDLLQALEDVCKEYRLISGVFWVSGVLNQVTVGTFDHRQQVYVTNTGEGLFELAACSGGMTWRHGQAFVWAHLVAFDEQGQSSGGRLLSPTIVTSGRIFLQELQAESFPESLLEQMDMAIFKPNRANSAQGP